MTSIYPELKIDRIKSPNRFYAVPIVGFLVKLIMVIPVGIELWVLTIAQFFVYVFNSFYISFKGTYWKSAYRLNLGIMRLETNLNFFLWGLTDTYPGFDFKTTNYTLDIAYNKKPNRLFATPILGLIIRFVMLLPYSIYSQVVSTASFIAILVSWTDVLFKKKYPATTFEIARDSIRVDQAAKMYYLGMSDSYPSWWISMNHQGLKILLLIAAALITLFQLNNQVQSYMRLPEQIQKQMEQPKTHSDYQSKITSPADNNYNYSY